MSAAPESASFEEASSKETEQAHRGQHGIALHLTLAHMLSPFHLARFRCIAERVRADTTFAPRPKGTNRSNSVRALVNHVNPSRTRCNHRPTVIGSRMVIPTTF